MGKWNRRYFPRRKFRNREYEDPPPSPPETYNTQSYIAGGKDNGIPSWEIDYCHSVRVSWRKVLASKQYIFCHPSVLNWDDSAGKDAFQNAKQRYWANINGLPCDNPLPDPNLYIHEINWNPYLDPELMADLDLQAFNLDNIQQSNKLETINEEDGCAQAPCDKNQLVGGSPWEKNLVQGPGNLKDDTQGWGKWDDSVNLKYENPWEQGCSQVVSMKGNAWRCGNESWGWPQGTANTEVRREGWGQWDNNHSWSWNVEGTRNFGDTGYSRGSKFLASSRGRGWRDNRDKSWGWKDNTFQSSGWRGSIEYNGNEPKYWDSQGYQRGGRTSRGGYRKRESSIQHTSKFKSSRYHSDTSGNSRRFYRDNILHT